MKVFTLPDLGEGLPDAEVHQWHVKDGDTIKEDDLLVSMETAKAVVDVPSPYSGTIVKCHGKAGDIIKVGEPLVEFDVATEEIKTPPTTEKVSKPGSTVAGAIEVGDEVIEEGAMGIQIQQSSQNDIKAMPAARALAKSLQINLANVTGTGPNHIITLQDVANVQGHDAQKETNIATPKSTVTTLPKNAEPLKGLRRAMARAMAISHKDVVPITIMDDADIHHWPMDVDFTVRILQAIVSACKAEPSLNAWYYSDHMAREIQDKVNIGLAIDTPDGLIVPVIKDAANLTAKQLRETINTYKQQARDRSFEQEALHDATIQLSNFGSIAGRYANPIIVPPTVAILGTGKVREAIVAANSAPVVHKILPLSLTFDHRAVTGGEASRFLGQVIASLEKSK